MKIAQVSPLYESVPPRMYGGTERVVSYLTEELVKLGHDVSLFASGDSITNANLVAVCGQATRLDKNCKDPLAMHYLQLQEVIDRASEFDIIHFHTDYLHYPFTNNNRFRHITTLHGRLDMSELQQIYRKFSEVPLVSISDSQRKPVAFANFLKTIYHGLPLDLYKKGSGEGGCLAFIGRISPEKRPDRAIKIARRAGMKIKIAAKVDAVDQHYFQTEIEPLLKDPNVEFIGEIGEDQKGEFLGNAKALLFPIDWPEPFGMVMIEAMANGTPVIAYRCGSVPEVIDPGETGFIVNSISEALSVVKGLDRFDRDHCREVFEKRFSATVMAQNYVDLYQEMINDKTRIYPLKVQSKTTQLPSRMQAQAGVRG